MPANVETAAISKVEDKLRIAAYTANIQVPEIFKSYDHLRTGFVTRAQLLRCLDQCFKIHLNNKEESYLWSKYGQQKAHQVNYLELSNAINCASDSDIPTPVQVYGNKMLNLAEDFNKYTMSENAEERCLDLLRRCKQYCKNHGIHIRSCFEDFDKHHEGGVTKNQFYRCFPGPPHISESDLSLLADRYYNSGTKLYDYISLQKDIQDLDLNMSNVSGQDSKVIKFDEVIEEDNFEKVFQKIRDAVYKHGVRTTDFFKDYDKHHSGIITENQFRSGLSLVCGSYAQLTGYQTQILVDRFKQNDGRIRYRDFCVEMENAFIDPELERKPLLNMYKPPQGALSRPQIQLTDVEMEDLHRILTQLSEIVRKRRLLLYPYFKDFDKKKGLSRSITKDQFARALHFLSLNIQPKDLQLLYKRFEHPKGIEIDYSAFVQAVDDEYVASSRDDMSYEELISSSVISKGAEKRFPVTKSNSKNISELLSRIKHILLTNRIRAFESFNDFDPLRCGSITENRFRMGLSNMGLSAMGKYHLSEAEFRFLSNRYGDPKRLNHIYWKKFVDDVDEGFTVKELEKSPTTIVTHPTLQPRLGATNWNNTDNSKKEHLETILNRMRKNVEQRRVLSLPFFRDFDKHNHGHVTIFQFHQCLTYMGIQASDEELQLVEDRFADREGFNYFEFLNCVQPEKREQPTYAMRLNARDVNHFPNQVYSDGTSYFADVQQVIDIIKAKAVKERIRVSEFMRDYDKLRSGRLTRSAFRRALDLCKFGLNIHQYSLIETAFQSQQAGYVDYVKFCDEIESAFTIKDLEKTPLAEISQYVVRHDVIQNRLTAEEKEILDTAMTRLASRVRQRRIQLFPLFEDYDTVRNGNVSKSQFRRVLSGLALEGAVSEREFAVLIKKYEHQVGGRSDIDYIAFCDDINDISGFEWRKP